MITVEPVPLTAAQTKDLSAWLARPEASLLVKVLEARAKEFGVKALNDAAQTDDSPMKIDPANAELKKAQRYSWAAKTIEAMRDQTSFTTVKLS